MCIGCGDCAKVCQQVVELIGRNNDLGQAYAQMPSDVPLKLLLILRNIAAEMVEPSSGRITMMMERAEGKVSDKLELTGKDGNLVEIGVRQIDYRTGITPSESGPGGDHSAPSQDKDPGDGSPLG